MIDILMQLADIGSTVTVVITKKDDNYLISVTPKTLSTNLQPVLISGTKEDIMADFPTIVNGIAQMKRSITNLEAINEKLDQKLKDKVAPAAPKTEKKTEGGKKGTIKVGSGTTTSTSTANDLFGGTVASNENSKKEEEVNAEDTEVTDEIEAEEISDSAEKEQVVQPEPEIGPKPKLEPQDMPAEEEEDIF